MSRWDQATVTVTPKRRGFHLITDEVVSQLPMLSSYRVGLAHIFLQHTSAALTLNENADPTVRDDMRQFFDRLVADDTPYFTHTLEGADDMPAHIKAVLLGTDLTIPISNGRLALGTWQGIYLCEHRNRGGRRRLIVTLNGE